MLRCGNLYQIKDLEKLKLDTLEDRRRKICLKFAKRCLQNDKVKNIFPINTSTYGMKTRKKNKYAVNQIRTERYKNLRYHTWKNY